MTMVGAQGEETCSLVHVKCSKLRLCTEYQHSIDIRNGNYVHASMHVYIFIACVNIDTQQQSTWCCRLVHPLRVFE